VVIMQIFARIAGGTVAELVEIPQDVALGDAFHPDLAAQMVPVPDPAAVAVGHGWDGQAFTPPDPPTPAVPVVQAVTMRQARLALLDAGLLDAVEAAVAAAPRAVRIEWEYATQIERASPLLGAIAAEINLDEAALDALFLAAAQL
jgi:hypothetical protein